MNEFGAAWFWMVAVVSLLIGAGIGFAVAARRLPAVKRSQELEEELGRMKAELNEYRGQVNEHFAQTSELFQALTERYRDVYQHLATGAQALCTDGQEALALDLPESGPLPVASQSLDEAQHSLGHAASESQTDAKRTEEQESGSR